MLTIPIQLSSGQYDLFIVLEDDNIARLKVHDPGEVRTEALGSFANLKIHTIHLLYGSAAEVKALSGSCTRRDVIQHLKNLARGWKFRPEAGDSDGPYQMPAKN